jgi:hypothetical protein
MGRITIGQLCVRNRQAVGEGGLCLLSQAVKMKKEYLNREVKSAGSMEVHKVDTAIKTDAYNREQKKEEKKGRQIKWTNKRGTERSKRIKNLIY